jgi:23S rRNA (uracil1939-C5)-methyltransferase
MFEKNMELELVIEDMAVDGAGIGKVNGVAFFVKDAVIGDRVLIKIIKMKKRYGYGRLLEVLEPSPCRIKPRCEFYRQCGGCQIQAMNYVQQLEFKEKKVRDNLERIGGFSITDKIKSNEQGILFHPIIGMEEPFFYRNKAQFPIGTDKDGRIITGFYAARSHQIIPNRKCYLGVEVNEEILDMVISFMEEYHISAYNETSGKGLVRHVLVRYGFVTKEIMVCLVVNGRKIPHVEKLVERLKSLTGMKSITLNVNEKNTNVILGDEIICLWGKKYITDYIGDIKYQISPLSFYQVNPVQTKNLYETALAYAGLTGTEIVWDLYCGIGTISLFLAQKARHVYGVEVVEDAIADARNNAKCNGIENVTFFVGRAEEVLPEFYEKGMQHPNVIVVDPPRKGCDVKCLETILKMKPERVVYVSCDPATLARDLKYLCRDEYELGEVQPVDMFPQSVHVESIVLLSHKSPDSTINVKVEFGEGEGKVPLDAIAERAKKYQPKPKITYKMIQEYVERNYGFKVHTAYIAEVKRSLGLTMYDAPNAVEELKQPRKHPPKEKVEAIKAALKYFEVI